MRPDPAPSPLMPTLTVLGLDAVLSVGHCLWWAGGACRDYHSRESGVWAQSLCLLPLTHSLVLGRYAVIDFLSVLFIAFVAVVLTPCLVNLGVLGDHGCVGQVGPLCMGYKTLTASEHWWVGGQWGKGWLTSGKEFIKTKRN